MGTLSIIRFVFRNVKTNYFQSNPKRIKFRAFNLSYTSDCSGYILSELAHKHKYVKFYRNSYF